jgi:signal transduction histidine kinase
MDCLEKYDTIVAMPPFGLRGDRSSAAIIESLYSRLNDGGMMAIVVPAGFLIEASNKAGRVKKILLEEHALYRIVLLPGDLLANTSISIAVLLIQKNGGGDTITLTDYSDFIKDNRKYGTLCKLDMEAIEDAEKTALLHELEDTTPKARFQIRMKTDDLLHDDAININPKYHINRTHVRTHQIEDMHYVLLGDLVEIYERANLIGGGVSVPMVRIQDLADTILTGKKDFLDLETEERKENNIPLLMEDNLLLVGLVGKTLKPTIFKLTAGHQIAYSDNIAPLRLKSSMVSIEYLQCELASDFMLEQILAHQVGGGRQFISRKNLLKLYVRVPKIEEQQKRIVDESREILSNSLIQQLGIENAELKNERYNEFVREMRVRKHAIGQVLNELNPAINTLLRFEKKNEGVLRGSDIISERFGYTVDDYLQKLRFLANKITTMVGSLTNEYVPKSEMQKYNVVQMLEEYKQNHSIEDGFELVIKHGYFASELHVPAGIELPDGSITEEINISPDDYCDFWSINVCKEDFFQVLDNIVANAKRYGFTEERPDYCICFEMEDIRDSKNPMVAIHVKNNGNPLPVGIKPEQVFMYGEGSSQCTGIGGWQIKQIVEGMGGKVELRTYEDNEEGFTIDYVLSFPDTSVVVLDE